MADYAATTSATATTATTSGRCLTLNGLKFDGPAYVLGSTSYGGGRHAGGDHRRDLEHRHLQRVAQGDGSSRSTAPFMVYRRTIAFTSTPPASPAVPAGATASRTPCRPISRTCQASTTLGAAHDQGLLLGDPGVRHRRRLQPHHDRRTRKRAPSANINRESTRHFNYTLATLIGASSQPPGRGERRRSSTARSSSSRTASAPPPGGRSPPWPAARSSAPTASEPGDRRSCHGEGWCR